LYYHYRALYDENNEQFYFSWNFETSGNNMAHQSPHCVINSSGHVLPIIQMDCEIYVAVTVAMVRIRTVFINTSNITISGVFKASNMNGRAKMTSCDMYFNGRHFIACVIDPTQVKLENKPKEDNSELPFDASMFTIPFTNCPPNAEVVVDFCYIQEMKFNNTGSYELLVPLQVPVQQQINIPPRMSQVHCVLDVGTPSCQWRCNSHQMYVVAQTGVNPFQRNQYLPPDTAACALQSQQFPTLYSKDFFIEYNGMCNDSITGSCLLEVPPAQYMGQPPADVCSPRSEASACVLMPVYFRDTLSCFCLQFHLDETQRA
jgi:hypothetical protein